MRLRPDGVRPYAPNTQNRIVTVAKTALSAAEKKGLINSVPWPRRKSGAAAKSDHRPYFDTGEERVPNVAQLRAILDAIPSHRPSSHLYRSLSAVCGFSGLRPGEAVALQLEDLTLPDSGWGAIRVTRAWSATPDKRWSSEEGTIAGPKTERSRRTVPIPPILTGILTEWIGSCGMVGGRLFLPQRQITPHTEQLGPCSSSRESHH
jgi:integrase